MTTDLSWGELQRECSRIEKDDEESGTLLMQLTQLDRGIWDCPICFNALASNVEAPCCGALFCGACIVQWVSRAVGRPRCPNCSQGLLGPMTEWKHNAWAQAQTDESVQRQLLRDEDERRAVAAATTPPTRAVTVEQRLSALEKTSELTMRSCQLLLREKAQMAQWRREQRAFMEALAAPSTGGASSRVRPERAVSGRALGAELRAAMAAVEGLRAELSSTRQAYSEMQLGMVAMQEQLRSGRGAVAESVSGCTRPSTERRAARSGREARSATSHHLSHHNKRAHHQHGLERRARTAFDLPSALQATTTAAAPPSPPMHDVFGVPRGACVACGTRTCPGFVLWGTIGLPVDTAALDGVLGAEHPLSENDTRPLLCQRCGCPSDCHVDTSKVTSGSTAMLPPSGAANAPAWQKDEGMCVAGACSDSGGSSDDGEEEEEAAVAPWQPRRDGVAHGAHGAAAAAGTRSRSRTRRELELKLGPMASRSLSGSRDGTLHEARAVLFSLACFYEAPPVQAEIFHAVNLDGRGSAVHYEVMRRVYKRARQHVLPALGLRRDASAAELESVLRKHANDPICLQRLDDINRLLRLTPRG